MKKKIIAYFSYSILAAIALTMVLTTILAYNLFERRVFSDLEISARLVCRLIEVGEDARAEIDEALRDELRVTLIAADGTVVYDNQADAQQMENHAGRPEVAEAIEEGEGRDIRNSSTVQQSTYYYAVRLGDGRVLRVAEEASSIWNIYLQATPLVLLIVALMMALSLWAANLLTIRLLRPIGEMTQQLDSMNGEAPYPELEPFMSMIKKQHEEILRSANMRVEFTANVSHELKTPLTSISGYAELIESGMAEGEQAGYFARQIHKSANRLLTLINDIIRLSQMDSPTTDLNLEMVDMGQVAADTVQQLRLNAEKMEVSLSLDQRQACVNADRHMMEELLYNLCDNAIRYNVRGGSVRVEVRPLKEHVIVCVQDTGIGISRENQEHVFERFYRVDKSRSKATGGTGLGLAIVKHIAAKHHATIKLESELGRGTTISVVFDRYGKNG